MRELSANQIGLVTGGYNGMITGTRLQNSGYFNMVHGLPMNGTGGGGNGGDGEPGGPMRENEGTDDDGVTRMEPYDIDGDGDNSERIFIDGSGQLWYIRAGADVGDQTYAFRITNVSIDDGDGNMSVGINAGWSQGPEGGLQGTYYTGTQVVSFEAEGQGVPVIRR